MLYGARLAAISLLCYAVTVFLELSVFPAGLPWKFISNGFDGFRISISGTIITVCSCIAIARFKVSTTYVIVGSAILGALLYPFIG